MIRKDLRLLAVAVVIVAACTERPPTSLTLSSEALLAKGPGGGGTSLYKVRFISGVTPAGDGEITSDWFPAAGISVSTNNPWRQIVLSGITIDLNNFTHGDIGQGGCATFIANYGLPLNLANWDIAGTDPTRSYAGSWKGGLTIKSGYLAFDGDRLVGGVVTPGAGGIHNAVTQQNATIETEGPNNDWFRQEVRNAGFKFSGASTPDGAPTTDSEMACMNYTIELRKASLIP